MACRNEVREDGILAGLGKMLQVAQGKSGFRSFVGPRANWQELFRDQPQLFLEALRLKIELETMTSSFLYSCP